MIRFCFPISLKDRDLPTKFIITTIRYAQDKNGGIYDLGAPLMAKTLQSILKKDYKRLQELIEEEIVVCDKHYEVGKKCRSYRLAPYLYDEEWLFRSYREEKGLLNRIKIGKEKQRKVEQKKIMGGNYEQCGEDIKHLKIKKVDWTEIAFVSKEKNVRVSIGSGKYKYKTVVTKPKEMELAARAAVDSIQRGDIDFSKDDYGRFHTNLTRLPKILRKNIYFDDCVGGDDLVEVDIVSSQPIFLTIFILSSLFPTLFHYDIQNIGVKQTVKMPQLLDTQRLTEEVNRLKGGLANQKFYEAISASTNLSREEAKKEFFHFAYSNAGGQCKSIVGKYFRKNYPQIFSLLLRIKRLNDYQIVAQKMQQIEAWFLYDRVLKRIREKVTFRIGTIHDCIICPKKYLNCVLECFDEEFKILGIEGKTKVKKLDGTVILPTVEPDCDLPHPNLKEAIL